MTVGGTPKTETMRVFESVRTFQLPDPRVWIAGDWHGNVGWLQTVMPALRRVDRHVSTLLHAGDWWMEPGPVDFWARNAGIERVLVTLGNHEPWGEIAPLMNEHPGSAIRVSEVIWLLPRPFRFEIGGRSFLSLGGAASVDRLYRTEGKDWWPDERILDAHVAAALQLHAEVMITHEPPAGTPLPAARALFATNPLGLPDEIVRESAASRQRVDRVWDQLKPDLLFHGHLHMHGEATAEDGRRVISLNREFHDGNIHSLDVPTLRTEALPISAIRCTRDA